MLSLSSSPLQTTSIANPNLLKCSTLNPQFRYNTTTHNQRRQKFQVAAMASEEAAGNGVLEKAAVAGFAPSPWGDRFLNYTPDTKIKALCRSYLNEARWRHNKYVPTLDEYMRNDLYRNSAYIATIVYVFLGLETATDHEFEWLCNLATPVKAVCYHLRILNDLGGKKFDRNRGLSSLFIEGYMKEYGLSYEEACKELYKKADELWKDINEGMIRRPSEVAVPVYNVIINMIRAVESIYDGDEDGLTVVNHGMKQTINTMYIDSIPM